jgi:N-acetylmuramoyl-L-alanine amidase
MPMMPLSASSTCYGGAINADEAYNRYVWLAAFICYKFQLDPAKSLVGHFFLDPTRKSDPVTGLAHSRRTYEQLLRDVVVEYNECTGAATPTAWPAAGQAGNARLVMGLNVRKGAPETKSPLVRTYPPGVILPYVSWVDNGQSINGNSKWYKDKDGNYFWSGGAVGA